MDTTIMDKLMEQPTQTTLDDADTNTTYIDYENVTSKYETSTSAEYDEYYEAMKADASVRVRVKFFMMAAIIPLGVIFNTVAFIIFAISKRLRRNTSGHFLIALTFADSTYLLGEILIWINTEDPYWGFIFGVRFTHANPFWCSTAFFLRNFGQFCSSWLTVAITLERCLFVWLPLKIRTITTITKARIIIICIFIVSAALNCYPYWIYKTYSVPEHDFYYCIPHPEKTYNYWYTGTFRIGALFIPGTVVLISTILLVFKLHKRSQVRKSMSIRTRVEEQQQQSIQRQMSTMLILVAIAFVLLRLPYNIASFVHVLRYGFNYSFNKGEDMVLDVVYCIAAINYGINLFLYSLSGNMFRKRLLACIGCHKLRRIISQRSGNTLSTNIEMASLKHKRNNKRNGKTREVPEANNI